MAYNSHLFFYTYPLLFFSLLIKYNDTRIDNISAKGTASHIPFTLNTIGRKNIPITIKTNVLIKEITADIFPLDNAVNSDEENILYPAKIYPIANNENPFLAISYTSVPSGVKKPTIYFENIREIINTPIDEFIISLEQILNILFNCF